VFLVVAKCHNPEDRDCDLHRREELKSFVVRLSEIKPRFDRTVAYNSDNFVPKTNSDLFKFYVNNKVVIIIIIIGNILVK